MPVEGRRCSRRLIPPLLPIRRKPCVRPVAAPLSARPMPAAKMGVEQCPYLPYPVAWRVRIGCKDHKRRGEHRARESEVAADRLLVELRSVPTDGASGTQTNANPHLLPMNAHRFGAPMLQGRRAGIIIGDVGMTPAEQGEASDERPGSSHS